MLIQPLAKTSSNSDPRKPSPSSSTAKYRRTTRSSKYEPDSDIEIIDPPPSTSASGKGGGKGKETERQHREKSVERSGNGKDPLARDGRTSSIGTNVLAIRLTRADGLAGDKPGIFEHRVRIEEAWEGEDSYRGVEVKTRPEVLNRS